MQAYIIHGHFYQPPREDPVTGEIPIESSAYPYKNWNERIFAECYRPNQEMGNFGKISFNIGPTLFSWLSRYHPDTGNQIALQDKENLKKYGVGNAMAQPYNHTILPLSSRRDKMIQIDWGVNDFIHRFGHPPSGMWLPETAVDMETAEVLAEAGIKFTILAPWQSSEEIDETEPFIIPIDQKRSLSVFFYQRELSTLVSFDPWSTVNADKFTEFQLRSYYRQDKVRRNKPQFVMLASDGELYGHHQPLRSYFLARLMDGAGKLANLESTYPAKWIMDYPPVLKTNLRERTSWSCHHDLGRWNVGCSCTPGDNSWKMNLFTALINLSEKIDGLYQEVTAPFFSDPWLLLKRYIWVMLGKVPFSEFIREMALKPMTGDQEKRVRLILEAQRERQRMFTSCGWFFDDFDRIEPRNNVAYAAQAIFQAYQSTGVNLEKETLLDFAQVKSNLTGLIAAEVLSEQIARAKLISDTH